MRQEQSRRDPIAAHQRKAIAQRRIGENAKCSCGEVRAEALLRKGDDIACAACIRKKQGKNSMDKHHVAGKANSSVTISIPVNDHRARLSVDQYDWPKRTLENPDRSPLIAAAACVRGFHNTIIYLVESVLGWIAVALESLDACLTEMYGGKWWLHISFRKFTPGGFDA